MKRRDLIRHLQRLGATFVEGGSHTKVTLNGRKSVIPRHTEIKESLAKVILRQLGADPEGD